jgi:lipid-A-disaccharide synthase
MLLKKPMVVAYRLPPVSYWLISRLVKTPYIALPNLLAGEALVPELLQDAATPAALTAALSQWLDEPVRVIALQARFAEIHGQLRRGASHVAAQAIVDMLEAN